MERTLELKVIPKKELIVGAYYKGECRNATEGRWDGKVFRHWRYKFGMWQIDTIPHFEDEKKYDSFCPYLLIYLYEKEIPL